MEPPYEDTVEESKEPVERRASVNKFTLPQLCIITLLITLLISGLFYYSALSTSQRLMSDDIISIRDQYVQLKMYINGQTMQDQEIIQMKMDILSIKKSLGLKTDK